MKDKQVAPTDEDTEAGKSKDEEADKKKDLQKPAPFLKMFSLASAGELLLLAGGIIGGIANGASQPVMIYIWGDMIDNLAGSMDMQESVELMCIVGVFTFAAAALQSFCLRVFAAAQGNKMRERYYDALIKQDISWFDLRTTASMASQLNDDAEKMTTAFGDKFGSGVQGFSTFVASIVMGFFLGWKLALVILAAVPLMAVGMIVMGSAMEAVAGETQGWYAKAAAVVEESLFALRTVVAFGGERRELENYTKAVTEAKKGAMRNTRVTALGMGYVEGIWACTNGAAFFFGMTLIYYNEVNSNTGERWTGGTVLTVFFSILIGGFSIGQLEPSQKAMKEAQISAGRFFDVVEYKNTIQCRGTDPRRKVNSFESFEFRNVHFSYPAKPDQQPVPVLKGVSFRISSGQKVAFVGESGSGKSTVMSLLERFYDPTEGFVMINGESLTSFDPTSVRGLIGYVGQEPVLFATSVRNNIINGWPAATNAEIDEVARMANLDFLDELPEKMNTFVGSGGSQFSGGQKQRIAIARALLRQPKVLFLDEATSALDSESEKKIQRILALGTQKESAQSFGDNLTIVSIAHRLSTIRDSDVIFCMKDGVVAEQGSHTDLMDAKGIYYGLAAAQEKGMDGERTDVTSEGNEVAENGKASPDNKSKEEPSEAKSSAVGAKSMTKMALDEDKEEQKRQEKVQKEYKTPTRRLLSYCKPEWPWFVPGVIGAALHGANNPLQAYLVVKIIASLWGPKDKMWRDCTDLSIQFIILGVVIFFATAVHMYSFGNLAESMVRRLRVALLTSVYRQEIGFHDDPAHTPGMIGMALQLWTYRVRILCADIEAKAATFSSIFFGLVLAFWGCWQVALAMLGSIPVLAAAGALQMVMMMGGTSAKNEKMKIAQQVVSDSVQNARTVHACGMEVSLSKYHAKLVEECSSGFALRALLSSFAFGFAIAAPMYVMAWGFWFSNDLMEKGEATGEDTLLALMGILYAAMGAGQFASMVGDAAKAKVACHDMFELMDRNSLIDGLDPEGAQPSWPEEANKTNAGQIEFENVQFFYPFRADVVVLKGVSFKIQSGQSVGLVGPSGGGKSTVMSLIQRFYDPSQGTVYIGTSRTPLSSLDIRWWRKQVGFVGQEPILFNTTVRANVLYGLDAAKGETISEERLAECKRMAYMDFIDNASNQGWETEVGARGFKLSGGQKQRVAICRALVRNPAVLLLDEATSALDTESERVVQQALEAARQGRTSFAIAHRLSTIQDCDVILVTAEGVIVESGVHAELVEKRGVYYKLQAAAGGGGDVKASPREQSNNVVEQ
jgi:ATP-binding cassette subfamily B (MDR/TAP) protein 1